jgi:type III pantothenate kinase
MILAVDVGNTTIQGGLFENDRLVLQFRKMTTPGISSDEFGIFLRSVIRENGFDPRQVKKIACCSVVPSINHSLANSFTKYFSTEALFVHAGIKSGLKIRYDNPREIGADRIVAAMGAVELFPQKNLVIVDMGTATTIDVVTKNREYLGGAILSGLKISVGALATGTAKLPQVEIVQAKKICGSSTIEAIQSGIYFGSVGAVKEFCSQIRTQIFGGEKPFVVATGGFSRLFSAENIFDEIIPELVLLGVKAALEKNS